MAILLVLISIIVGLCSAFYLFINYQYTYWKKRNVPFPKPVFFWGNLHGAGKTKHFSQCFREGYAELKGRAPFGGFYFFFKPVALILDPELVKCILIKDFSNFADRGMFTNERDDPLTGNLFTLDGAKWKRLRNKLSPTFTSGKMKFMYPTVVDVGQQFTEVFGQMVEDNAIVEIKDVLARFTTDVIGTCAFGIECNSLRDPNAQFRVMGKKVFTDHRYPRAMMALMQNFPNVAKTLRLKFFPDEVIDFFMNAVRQTVEYREKNGITRNDFMDSLIELKKTKVFRTESGEEIHGLTMEELAAQAFVFFLAGFETSSTTMGFCLYELALNQDIQNKLREEITRVVDANNGELPYEYMKDMKYMDQVINETLRKYAIVPGLFRQAQEDYKVPNSDLVIEKGTLTIIPADAIHHDPEIYPEPAKFDPDRFLPEEILKRHPCTWLPFGDGPRNCVGLRFGQMQARIGLTVLLRNFRFFACGKTQIPIQLDLQNDLVGSKGGIYLKVEKISN